MLIGTLPCDTVEGLHPAIIAPQKPFARRYESKRRLRLDRFTTSSYGDYIPFSVFECSISVGRGSKRMAHLPQW